jgi:hypothetical protein
LATALSSSCRLGSSLHLSEIRAPALIFFVFLPYPFLSFYCDWIWIVLEALQVVKKKRGADTRWFFAVIEIRNWILGPSPRIFTASRLHPPKPRVASGPTENVRGAAFV